MYITKLNLKKLEERGEFIQANNNNHIISCLAAFVPCCSSCFLILAWFLVFYFLLSPRHKVCMRTLHYAITQRMYVYIFMMTDGRTTHKSQ